MDSEHKPSKPESKASESKTSFKELKLIEPLMKALDKQKYTTPTPIQSKSIPDLLLGRDLIGIAQTGTGKTASFVLPLLQRMDLKTPRVQGHLLRVLVLAPTRELASQIGESFSAYGQFLPFRNTVVFGGVAQGGQVNAIQRGVDIIVATPGRLLDLVQQRRVNLNTIEYFVLDEADRMLDMGFIEDIKKIIARLPQKRQTLFFSATMSPEIHNLTKNLLKNPIHVEITPQATTVEKIKQSVFFVDQGDKEKLLLELLQQQHLTRVLVFTRTKHRANKVGMFLSSHGIKVDEIHGNKSQNARQASLRDFKTGRIKVLVATDIAARGIDIDDISHVVNYELPNQPETYVHRIGRTARAGAEGAAFSFCAADERNYLSDIERLTRQKIEVVQHTFHSDRARNATGAAARPAPKNQRGQQRGSGYQGRGNSQGGRGGSQGRDGGRGRGGSGSGSRGNSRGQSRDGPKSTFGNRSHGAPREGAREAPRSNSGSSSSSNNSYSGSQGGSSGSSRGDRPRSNSGGAPRSYDSSRGSSGNSGGRPNHRKNQKSFKR